MKDNKELIVKKESIFSKIRNYVIGLLKTKDKFNEIEKNEEKREAIFKENSDFKKSIRFSEDSILRVIRKFENGEMTEDEMTEDEKKTLYELYDNEIREISKRTALKTKRLQELRKNSKNKNPNYTTKLWKIKKVG